MRVAAALALLALLSGWREGRAAGGMVVMSHAQTQYALRCGGCHGTVGLSPPASVPVLRGRAGYFLCTAEARRYLVQLPNIAGAQLDDAGLTELLNFITAGLGGAAHGRPYSVEEVATYRRDARAIDPTTLPRKRIIADLIRKCGAPADLFDYK